MNVKKNMNNLYILIGGDFNRHRFGSISECFLDIETHELGHTCGRAELDKLATNLPPLKTSVRQPFSNDSGSRTSDHAVIYVRTLLKNKIVAKKRTIEYKKFTEEGSEEFGKKLLAVDWVKQFEGDQDPTELVEKMNNILGSITNSCFKTCKKTVKETDAPWISNNFKKELRRRRSIYNKQERSNEWKNQKKITDKILREDKTKYYDRVKSKLTEKGARQLPYRAIKDLKGGERPQPWDVRDIHPDLDDQQTADCLADFFNAILDEFRPLAHSDVPRSWDKAYELLQPYQVSKRLKEAKKPKSMVNGDLFPQLVEKYCDILAIPLTKIFNMIMWTYHWPSQWKLETVTVIPKNNAATSYEECRNLSCTPLFSKILETYMMERISSEVKIDPKQYGGIKGCGTEHFLIQSWNNILNGLEDNRGSVNLITIDFSKAFNRMSHQECIQAFFRKGASNQTLNLIAAFLSGRRMAVKINQKYSSQRAIKGGSPQGCVSANALFCATIENLQDGNLDFESDLYNDAHLAGMSDDLSVYAGGTILEDVPPFEHNGTDMGLVSPFSISYSSPIAPPDEFAPKIFSSPASPRINYPSHITDYSSLSFTLNNSSPQQRHQAGLGIWNRLFDSTSSESILNNNTIRNEIAGVPVGWREDEGWNIKYIDDGLSGETICKTNAVCHITQRKERKLLYAKKSEIYLKTTTKNAEKIGMRINANKTKMLCITVAKNSMINSFINLPDRTQILYGGKA